MADLLEPTLDDMITEVERELAMRAVADRLRAMR